MLYKNMRTVALAVLLILFLLLCRACSYTQKSLQTANHSIPDSTSFFLRSENDHLIVTLPDGSMKKITDVDPRTLPPYDQNALKNGISLKNQAALEELLQDFS